MGGRTDKEQRECEAAVEGAAEVGDDEYAVAPTCKTLVFPSGTPHSTSAEKAGTSIQGRLHA